jgi:thioesterase domain-containing protein
MLEMVGETSGAERPPLCPVNFALQQSFVGMGDEVRSGEFAATTSPSFNAGALYDLNFFMVRRPEGWRISCEGDLDLYDVETIDGHLAKWREMLESVEIKAEQPAPAAAQPRPVQAVQTAQARADVGVSGFMSRAELEAKAHNIVRFNEHGTQTPIIVLNNIAVFYELAQQVGAQRPVVDMPMVPKTPQHLPPRAFEDLAADAVRLIKTIQPEGPYILMGYCVLGAMALEAAHQLRREGDTVELVILNDSWCPGYREQMPWYDRLWRKVQVRMDDIPRDYRLAKRGEISMIHFLQQFRTVRLLRLTQLAVKFGILKNEGAGNMIDENLWYGRNIGYLREQQARYRPAPYDGDVQIFRSAQVLKGRLFSHAMGWDEVITGKLVVTEVPGLHNQMFRAAGSAVIGQQLRERLSA